MQRTDAVIVCLREKINPEKCHTVLLKFAVSLNLREVLTKIKN